MDYLNLFRNYLKTLVSKQDRTKIISERSQYNYIRQVKYLDKYFRAKAIINANLFEISDMDTLLKLDKQFKIDENLKLKNERVEINIV